MKGDSGGTNGVRRQPERKTGPEVMIRKIDRQTDRQTPREGVAGGWRQNNRQGDR